MKKVIIVGVGALGSHVAMLLRGEAELRLIDFDRVEMKNTASQFHAKTAVGKNKTMALAQTFQFLWSTKVETRPTKLTEDNATQLLGGGDLIVDCLDNAEARRVVQSFARAQCIPCLHGGLAADGALGRSVWDEHFVADEAVEGAATCEGGEHLPFIAIAAGYIARSAQLYLRTGRKRGFQVYDTGATAL